jgi:hypothetical protein
VGSTNVPKTGPFVADRPGLVEGAETVGRGRIGLEGAYTVARSGDRRTESIGDWELRWGPFERLEVRVGLPTYVWFRPSDEAHSGFEDSTIAIKRLLSKGSGRPGMGKPKVAATVFSTVPTATTGLGEDEWQPGARLTLGWDSGRRVSFRTSLGYERAAGHWFNRVSAGAAFHQTLAKRLSAFLEYVVRNPAGDLRLGGKLVDAGLYWRVSDDVQIDTVVGVGLEPAKPDDFAQVGVVRRW